MHFFLKIAARQFKYKNFDQDHWKFIDHKCFFLSNIFFKKLTPPKDNSMIGSLVNQTFLILVLKHENIFLEKI